MTSQSSQAKYIDEGLKPNSFLYWQGRTYQVEQPEGTELDPLVIWSRDMETLELIPFRIEDLLLPQREDEQAVPLFAPTLERLKQEIKERYLPPPPVALSGLADNLVQRAATMVRVVETVERWLRDKERLARLQGTKMNYTREIEKACLQVEPPVKPNTYYKYRRVYRAYAGDLARMAAALRRSTFNQVQLSRAQLHFVDTLILRYYAGQRTVRPRPQMLYAMAQDTLKRTHNLWLDPERCPGGGAEHVVAELFDTRLPMQAILDNPEKANWLTAIELPSRSWFYRYLHWFEAQPDQGKAVLVARHGEAMWEDEYMVFDTYVSRATHLLQYVFADHWLVNLFIVDEATRSRVDRLWLTLLIDAYSRCVLGLALVYEAPCIQSIQSALRHAIWPKISHRALGIQEDWICYGIMQQLFLDNAWAHHAYSLEQLSRAISHKGKYNSIDLVFRPPYCGRYGALIERLFGNFSGQLQELLPEAISSSDPKHIQNAARQARLLYQDVYYLLHRLIVRYQHTPHRELGGMTPHQKWLEGWQLGYPGQVPPLTPAVDRLFWRRSPETRVISQKGISAFGLHYWSPDLSLAPRKGLDGQAVRYEFSYEPADISRLAIFSAGEAWVGDVYAKELRRADGSSRPVSLWERQLAQDLARDKGQASRDWLAFVTEVDELGQQRAAEKKRARGRKTPLRMAKPSARPEAGPVAAAVEAMTAAEVEQDYTDLLRNFVSGSAKKS